jgi:hypothetical protein
MKEMLFTEVMINGYLCICCQENSVQNSSINQCNNQEDRGNVISYGLTQLNR